MENTRFLKITIGVLVLVNIATLVFLWNGHSAPEGRMPPPGERGPAAAFKFLSQELGLSDEQQKKLENMGVEHHREAEKIDNLSRPLHHRFFSLLGKNDSVLMMQLADSMAWCQKQRELMTYRHFSEIRNICNAEQQKHFDEIVHDALRIMAPPRPGGPGAGGPGPRP